MPRCPPLATKLHIPPLRPDLVRRSRLIERLHEGIRLGHRLTLISAPVGFGKTTLLSEWAHAMGRATPPTDVAWISLDEGDNDLARFLEYVVAALQTLALSKLEGTKAKLGAGVLAALRASKPPPTDAILTSLINDMAAIPDKIILVLDDYHLVEDQPIHDALVFLLRHLPPPIHLAIASRDDPDLPLARLRARGQLTELRAKDLRFSTSEAAEFLSRVTGLDLAAQDVTALESRTEGWVAGLQLAAISVRGHEDASSSIRSFSGSHRFVLDYLIDEVLAQQPESIQLFLLQTAVLDRLTGSLCDAVRFGEAKAPSSSVEHAVRFGTTRPPGSSEGTPVTGQDDGQAMLEALDRANLFIVSLDEERRWYRYHYLFADLLRQRLHRAHPEQVPTLHLRASEWYEQKGCADEAIDHALRAENYERAAHLIEEHIDAVQRRGEHTRLRRWLSLLPPEQMHARPHLCVFRAWYLFASGQQDAAERSLRVAERALDTSTASAPETLAIGAAQLPSSEVMKIRGRAAAIRAFMASYRSDAHGIIKHAHRALAYLPEDDLSWRSTAAVALGDAYVFKGQYDAAYQARLEALSVISPSDDTYLFMDVSMKLALNLRAQGHLSQALKVCTQRMQLATESAMSQTAMAGWLLSIWGELLAETNDLDAALDLVRKGVELTESGKDVGMLAWSYLCLTRVLYSSGDLLSAERFISKMEAIARQYTAPRWVANLMAAWQVRIWLAQDELDAASQWIGVQKLELNGEATYVDGLLYVALARILIAQDRFDDAHRLLARLLKTAEAGAHTSRELEILLLQALAFQASGDTAPAMTPLEQALTLAEPGGFIRAFVDEGPPMARLLHEAATRGIAPDYTRRLLTAFPSTKPMQADPSETQNPQSELVEPLSERELEVLQLIAEGLANRELASRLFLSLNTVKAHTRNIYGKLNVHSRTQAIARARGLGLLQRR